MKGWACVNAQKLAEGSQRLIYCPGSTINGLGSCSRIFTMPQVELITAVHRLWEKRPPRKSTNAALIDTVVVSIATDTYR
jgi:hypothetical protein